MTSLTGWANWVVSVATDTVNEIIAEGKQELAGGPAAAAATGASNEAAAAPRSLWDPLTPSSTSAPSTFWHQNPMQWGCLIRCLALDVNTFMIPKSACLQNEQVVKLLKEIGSADNDDEKKLLLSADSKRKMVKEYEALAMLRYDLVPRWVDEPEFWEGLAWRSELLAATTSVEQAVNLLQLLNTEFREIPSTTSKKEEDKDDDEEKKKEDDDADQKEQHIVSSPSPKKRSLLDQLLLASPTSSSSSTRVIPYANVLRRRGFGTVQPDAALMHDLAERIHATGEKETWINNFTSRATKQLESVHSSVAMLAKLLSEVEVILSKSSSSSGGDDEELNLDQEDDDDETAMPSLELLQSVAESCKFHKGRVAGLIGELESSPVERVVGTQLDPNASDDKDGKLYAELKNANQRLGDVLAKQIATMRVLGEASQERERSIASTSTVRSPASAHPASSSSPKQEEAVFNPVMPWDDE